MPRYLTCTRHPQDRTGAVKQTEKVIKLWRFRDLKKVVRKEGVGNFQYSSGGDSHMNATGMLFSKLESKSFKETRKTPQEDCTTKKTNQIMCTPPLPLNKNQGERHLSSLRDFVWEERGGCTQAIFSLCYRCRHQILYWKTVSRHLVCFI